ncbi:sigma-70 family RNA polymerase sigma factor [Ornithinibacillus sp. BX22]|uniref:Sigma-70 family RNA polymerase sigma factor n=2 Tax=Ornithinibacillus TaxID=484508 RepID=A0A923L6G1_9BACI|nr:MULTISPECIES: sigma-70 family RNA polymerase sigma factor [Ornithinibacillus]MBC5637314.1 sigma-70 family RNA polymerase sigma factor [Ornithinibacillus hominis]MBS3680378.1 sigma-70 family RNA polymerase sigma factor [Ornithinibacillus massiliensis]
MKDNLDYIYHTYFLDIYRFLLMLSRNHHTAEDLVQETFIRAHLYIENYKGESVKAWLFTIAHHVFIDYYRKHKKMMIKEDTFFTTFMDKKNLFEEDVVRKEEIQEIIYLLNDLPEKQRYAVLLHDVHGLTQAEASSVMGVKQSYFKVLLFRGRQYVRQRREQSDER